MDPIVIPTGRVDPVTPLDQVVQEDRFKRLVRERQDRHAHLWTVHVLHLIDPPLEGATLSAASIALPPLVVCFICEQQWRPGIGGYCPGDPNVGRL